MGRKNVSAWTDQNSAVARDHSIPLVTIQR
jgi:hypothetical protein